MKDWISVKDRLPLEKLVAEYQDKLIPGYRERAEKAEAQLSQYTASGLEPCDYTAMRSAIDGEKEARQSLSEALRALAESNTRAEKAERERDAAVEAVKNMAEYIVCVGRVDCFLCDDIGMEHHLKYQPKNDGNYENAPCYECIADWFLQGHEWQENCW